MAGGFFPFTYVLKADSPPRARSPDTRCARSLDRPLIIWTRFKRELKKNGLAEINERELAGNVISQPDMIIVICAVLI